MRARWLRRSSILVICVAGTLLHAQSSSSSRTGKPASHAAVSPAAGSLSNGVYRNPFFSITCKVPYGWVDRTAEMQSEAEAGKSWVLLGTFEHPPEAASDKINSGIVMAAESLSVYPGMKSPGQYLHVLSEVTTGKGFKADGDPYEQTIGGRTMIRGDFSQSMGPVTMHQATLTTISKGYALSLTFIAGSADEIDDLVKGLTLGAAKAAP